jgi:glycosyltransferase involved in cell wall biosynthesis
MKIALIGPGIMTIPPPGHGAVEILIWDYFLELINQGHDVDIINKMRIMPQDQSQPNTPYCQELIRTINSGNYDFVHLHYDCLYHIMPFLNCKKIGITSHYPYIDQPEKYANDGYSNTFHSICNNQNHNIFALSKKDYHVFQENCKDKSKLFLLLNGSNHSEIQPVINKVNPGKSVYIGKVEERKLQHKYCNIPNIDFYGKCDDQTFKNKACYKGEPSREELMSKLANYGNMVLLSTGENGTPLVIKEALMAGLPIVTNKYSSNDLDLSLSFIDIIPDDKLDDLVCIQQVIEKNLQKQYLQNEIRAYAVSKFSWEILVKTYLESINSINSIAQ